jgi:4a-hydroxytetrahydrobiopterin dehydratase
MENQPLALVQTALSATQVIAKLAQLEGWKLFGDGAELAIEKTFHFPGYLQTMAFANAVAYIAESSKHHPELLIQSQACSVRWNTRDVQGISATDFACAAKVDALLNPA